MKLKKNNNTTIKIIAIVFAIFLWAYVMGEVNPMVNKTFTNVRVQYDYLEQLKNKNLVLMTPESSTIDIQVNGRRNDILKLKNSDFVAKIDFRGYGSGEQKIPVEVSSTFSSDLIVDYNPKQILVNIDKKIERQLPVSVNYINEVPSPYSLGKVTLMPNKVLVKGPKLILDEVNKIQVNLDLSEMTSDVEEVLPIQLIGEDGKDVDGLTKDPQLVAIKAEVLKNKRITIKPKIEGEPLEGYKLMSFSAIPQTALIRGPEKEVDLLKQVYTEPVDISYAQEDIMTESLLDLPSDVELIEPETIQIKAHIEAIIEKKLEIQSSEILLESDLAGKIVDFEKSPKVYEVIIRGPKEVIENIELEDLNPKIKQDELITGLNKVRLYIDLPSEIKYLDQGKLFDLYIKENE
ncbi:MAG: CdaR family protein [Tissierellales bacterium]|jgi:YbbR domain-containing protein|nr:CdaR family protein [Tissierellales bacterium]